MDRSTYDYIQEQEIIKFHKKLMREINIVRNMVYGEPLKNFDLEEETHDQQTKNSQIEESQTTNPTVLPS